MRGGGLFHLERMMVSVLHKELECNVEKLKCKKVGGYAMDQNQIRTSILDQSTQSFTVMIDY